MEREQGVYGREMTPRCSHHGESRGMRQRRKHQNLRFVGIVRSRDVPLVSSMSCWFHRPLGETHRNKAEAAEHF